MTSRSRKKLKSTLDIEYNDRHAMLSRSATAMAERGKNIELQMYHVTEVKNARGRSQGCPRPKSRMPEAEETRWEMGCVMAYFSFSGFLA